MSARRSPSRSRSRSTRRSSARASGSTAIRAASGSGCTSSRKSSRNTPAPWRIPTPSRTSCSKSGCRVGSERTTLAALRAATRPLHDAIELEAFGAAGFDPRSYADHLLTLEHWLSSLPALPVFADRNVERLARLRADLRTLGHAPLAAPSHYAGEIRGPAPATFDHAEALG